MSRILFAIFFFSTQALAGTNDEFVVQAAQGCSALLGLFAESGNPSFAVETEEDRKGDFWKPSDFVIESSRPGLHGGKRDVLKKRAGLWFSFGGEFPTAPQGDPRWPILVFGEKGAKFLGFEILDDERMTIPDAAELNGALEKINRHLTKKIRLRFYDLPEGTNFARYDHYVQKFHRERLLPIAGTLTSRLHDLSHHLGAIFIPELILERYDRHLEEFALALKALKKHIVGDSENPDILAAAETVAMLAYFSPAVNIDGSTSMAALYGKNVAESETTDEEFEDLLSNALRILSGQLIPETHLEGTQEKLDQLFPNLDPRGPVQSVLTIPAGLQYDQFFQQVVDLYRQGHGPFIETVDFHAPHLEDFEKAQATLLKERPGLFAEDGPESLTVFLKKFLEERSQKNPEYFSTKVLGNDELCSAFGSNLRAVREAVNKAATQ